MRRYVQESFLDSGLAPAAEIAQQCHCIAPGYLRDQIARSLANLGLESHRPLLPAQRRDAARGRGPRDLPGAHAAGDRNPGRGSRRWPDRRVGPGHVGRPARSARAPGPSLARRRARDGQGGRRRRAPLPRRAAALQSRDGAGNGLSVAGDRAGATARHAGRPCPGLAAFGSASILQGRLAAVELPEEIAEAFPGLRTSGQQSLQFARSAPGVTTALVGVSSPEHAAEDFALAKIAPLSPERILGLFT